MSQPDWIGQWRQLHDELGTADWPDGVQLLVLRRDRLIVELGSLAETRELAVALEHGKQAVEALRSRWEQLRDADRDSLTAMITEQQRLSAIANYASTNGEEEKAGKRGTVRRPRVRGCDPERSGVD